MIEVEFDDKGFTLQTLFLEKLPSALSFNQIKNDGQARPTQRDTGPIKVKDQDECADRALVDDQITGFIYCAGDCYTMSRRLNDTDAGNCISGTAALSN